MAPATPGTVLCLAATVCLALASFSTPLIKQLYFLRANISTTGFTGKIDLGTLGYCTNVGGTQTCSSPSVGYDLDLDALLNIPIVNLPQVVGKWLTYVLVLHIVALGLAALATVLGAIAHCQKFAMTCLSTFSASLASSVALIAFIFDIVLFLLARTRIRGIGGSSSLGPAVWLTLAGFVCLVFSGCAFGCGRRCISGRGPRNPDGGARGKRMDADDRYAEEARLEAMRSEDARRLAANANGSSLPGFQPYAAESQPLNTTRDQWLDEDDGAADPSLAHSQAYRDQPDPLVVGGYPRSAMSHGESYAQGGFRAGVGSGGNGLDAYGQPMVAPGLHRQSSDAYYAAGQQSPGGYPALAADTSYHQNDIYTNPYDSAPHSQTSGYAPQQDDYHNSFSNNAAYGGAIATYGQATPQPTMSPVGGDPRRAMQAGFVSPSQAAAAQDPYGGYLPQPSQTPAPSATHPSVYQPAPVRLQNTSGATDYYDAQEQLTQQGASISTAPAPAAHPPSYELTAMEGGGPSGVSAEQSGYAREKMGYQRQ